MPYSTKTFAVNLNQCLDDIDTPQGIRERTMILSKMLSISRQLARNLLEGQQLPDVTLLQQIAKEFEVEPNWLLEHYTEHRKEAKTISDTTDR